MINHKSAKIVVTIVAFENNNIKNTNSKNEILLFFHTLFTSK